MTTGDEEEAILEESAGDPRGEPDVLFRQLVESGPTTTFVYSRDSFEVSYISPQVEELLGYSPSEILGAPSIWMKIVDPADAPVVRMNVADLLARAGKYAVDYRVTLKSGGKAWIHDEGRLLGLDGKPDAVVGVLTDVTATKRLEERLLQAEKLRTLGLLAAGLAHDFGNILTVIKGYATLGLQQTPAGNPARLSLQEMLRSAERATEITRRLMVFARKRQEAPLPLDLNTAVREVQLLIGKLLGENVRVALRLATEPCVVLLDPAETWQIVLNLALNARDAMPQGGDLAIETTTVPEGAAADASSFVLLTVSDSGTGMEPETLARAFDPFFSTKDSTAGMGLGLATVQSIVQARGGSVQAASRPGEGTVISVFLPRIHEAVPSFAILGGATVEVRPTETVLVVEDDEAVRTLLRTILRTAGYYVLDAGSAEEALEMSEHFKDEIHVLVTDVVLPLRTGPELARLIRQTRPKCELLFLSGYSTGTVRNFTAAAGEQILQKPFPPATLLTALRAVLKR